jgi:hypothetical protein
LQPLVATSVSEADPEEEDKPCTLKEKAVNERWSVFYCIPRSWMDGLGPGYIGGGVTFVVSPPVTNAHYFSFLLA